MYMWRMKNRSDTYDIPSATVPKRDPLLPFWAGAGGGAGLTASRIKKFIYNANLQNNLDKKVTRQKLNNHIFFQKIHYILLRVQQNLAKYTSVFILTCPWSRTWSWTVRSTCRHNKQQLNMIDITRKRASKCKNHVL